ncbi:hypothetical protein QNM99_12235 [Pseudomonas sp. PCH446]
MLGSPVLAWVNVISVAMYVYAYRAFSQRRNRLAILLIRTEVLVHAGLGTVLIGWESGFHYFLLMFIPALFVTMRPAAPGPSLLACGPTMWGWMCSCGTSSRCNRFPPMPCWVCMFST